ncbi:MAG TPA: potassium-transporting ATPase subunit KdpC [Actinomycetes bacterium]
MPNNLSASLRQYAAAVRVLLVLTVLLGIVYPLAVTGVGQLLFRAQANGSLVSSGGHVVGSGLIGQNFTDAKGNPLPQWFQPRPSAAGASGYDPTSSSASNLGPSDPDLVKAIQGRRASAAALDGVAPASVPPDALTASGSGLDPQISPAYAYEQVNRVAAARSLDPAKVKALVASMVQGRSLGFLGEPTVDVLQLNIALQQLGG